MFVYADGRDWEGLRGVLADEVYLDYTSLSGCGLTTIPADEVVACGTLRPARGDPVPASATS
jgi:hypothetical protein